MLDGLPREEVVLHEVHAALQADWQVRSAFLDDIELVLYYQVQQWKALRECYADAALGATDVHDGPASQGLPRKSVKDVSGFETWPGTEPCHSRCIACLSVGVLGQLGEYCFIRIVSKIESLFRDLDVPLHQRVILSGNY